MFQENPGKQGLSIASHHYSVINAYANTLFSAYIFSRRKDACCNKSLKQIISFYESFHCFFLGFWLLLF